MQPTTAEPQQSARSPTDTTSPGRFFIALLGLIVVLVVLYVGFLFLRSNSAPQIVTALVAIVWGVGGIAALFTAANLLVESLPLTWQSRIQPYVFVGPAIAMLAWFLAIPTLRTLYQSFFSNDSTEFVGLQNYIATFSDRQMQLSFRNNVLWLFLGTGLSVLLGLVIAVLADRSKFENIAKSLIFMPMAISFVGAGVIWKFIYAYAPTDQPQIGVLNAMLVGLGGSAQSWISLQPWNNFLLIVVVVWLQTGFAMVILSAALKGVPEDILEAARVDGATEVQAFFGIIIPYLMSTIITVTTTTAIAMLKIFDVVIVMTGGQYSTEVVATQFYRQFFINRNFGYGSAIAIVLFIAVTPVIFYNLRQLRKQEGF